MDGSAIPALQPKHEGFTEIDAANNPAVLYLTVSTPVTSFHATIIVAHIVTVLSWSWGER